jgi:hypothetical protein
MKSVTLPSGKKIEVALAPFVEGKRLYQAVASELIRVDIDSDGDVSNVLKNVLLLMVSSPKVEEALEPCLRRCTYDGKKLSADTFEPPEARADYVDFCTEVAKENLLPFTKSLYAQFSGLQGALSRALSAESSTTQKVS